MEIINFIADLPCGDVEMVKITDDYNNVTQMSKAHYQELEAAKEVKADEAKTNAD